MAIKAYCDKCTHEIPPSEQELCKITYVEKQVSLGQKEMQERLVETNLIFCEKCTVKIKEFLKK